MVRYYPFLLVFSICDNSQQEMKQERKKRRSYRTVKRIVIYDHKCLLSSKKRTRDKNGQLHETIINILMNRFKLNNIFILIQNVNIFI